MNQGIKTIIYPVKDMERAKALYSKLLGLEPAIDEPYYVQFNVGDQNIGLDPNGHQHGMTAYYHVEDIKSSLQGLLDAGSELVQDIKDVGGGGLIASVKDPNGNIIGLAK